eukprot:scaffold73750_cov63-Phaeocystis_antarctica.AAC.2
MQVLPEGVRVRVRARRHTLRRPSSPKAVAAAAAGRAQTERWQPGHKRAPRPCRLSAGRAQGRAWPQQRSQAPRLGRYPHLSKARLKRVSSRPIRMHCSAVSCGQWSHAKSASSGFEPCMAYACPLPAAPSAPSPRWSSRRPAAPARQRRQRLASTPAGPADGCGAERQHLRALELVRLEELADLHANIAPEVQVHAGAVVPCEQAGDRRAPRLHPRPAGTVTEHAKHVHGDAHTASREAAARLIYGAQACAFTAAPCASKPVLLSASVSPSSHRGLYSHPFFSKLRSLPASLPSQTCCVATVERATNGPPLKPRSPPQPAHSSPPAHRQRTAPACQPLSASALPAGRHAGGEQLAAVRRRTAAGHR